MTWRSLAKKSEFQDVYGKGAKAVGRFLVVYLLPADDFAQAVVASRKVGGAVQRNRGKRLLREALQAARKSGRLPAGISVQTTVGEGSAESGDISDTVRYFSGNRERIPEQVTQQPPIEAAEIPNGQWVVLVARQRILQASSQAVREELDSLLDQGTSEIPRSTIPGKHGHRPARDS
jgi:ribonuclease P protein component